MDHIFLVLDYFSHISDALQGEFIKALTEKYRVVIITRYLDTDAARRGNYFFNANTIYRKLNIRYPKLWTIFNSYIRHALVRAYDDLYVTRSYYYRPDHPLPIRFLTAVGRFLPKRWAGTAPFTFVERIFGRPSREFKELVRTYRPTIMITSRPGLSVFEAEMIIFAKNIRIPTAAVNINYDNPYSVAKFYRNTDYILTWNPTMKSQIEGLHGYPGDRVLVAGCLRFDHYFSDGPAGFLPTRDAFLRSKNLDPDKKTIVWAGPSPIMYPPRREFFETLLELKRSGALDGDPNILIRTHPHDTAKPYEGWDKIDDLCVERAGHQRLGDGATKGQKVEMDEDDLLNLTATLSYADVVLNFASTMIIEASIFNKPIVNIGFPEERRWVYRFEFNQALLNSGAVRLANNPEELKTLINQYLRQPELDDNCRRKLVAEYVFFTDGRSYARAVDAIEKIVAEEKIASLN